MVYGIDQRYAQGHRLNDVRLVRVRRRLLF